MLLALAGDEHSGPIVTVSSLSAEGVLLHRFSDPRFQSTHLQERAQGFDRILPYTVIIENASDQNIAGHTVLWKCTGTDAVARIAARRNTFDASMLEPGRGLLSKSSKIVSMFTDLEAGGRLCDPSTQMQVNEMADRYSCELSIDISLDAVLFADGAAVGPDVDQSIMRWKAWIDAQRVVFHTAANSSSVDLESILQSFVAPGITAPHRTSPDATRHFADFGMGADRAKTYEECFDLSKAYYAGAILDELSHGNVPTIQNIRAALTKIDYPEVRKK